jgi:hypothetical protein
VKIEKHYRPELVVSKGKDASPLLTDPFLDAKNKRLVATNGAALVALPVVVDDGEASRYLACSLLKAARGLGEPEERAEIRDEKVVRFGVLWPTAQERTFPEWKKVVPKFARGVEGTVTFALNPSLLFAVAHAMGQDGGVALTIELGATEDNPTPILVQPLNANAKEFGLLMPMKADGAGIPLLAPGQVCPTCHRLLAAGAPCPDHGYPSQAEKKVQEQAALQGQADAILKNGGSGDLAKKDLAGEAVARKKGRR